MCVWMCMRVHVYVCVACAGVSMCMCVCVAFYVHVCVCVCVHVCGDPEGGGECRVQRLAAHSVGGVHGLVVAAHDGGHAVGPVRFHVTCAPCCVVRVRMRVACACLPQPPPGT